MRWTWMRAMVAVVVAATSFAIVQTSQPSAAEAQVAPTAAGRSAIYGGGPFYQDGQGVMDVLRSSGFTTVILWSIHVHDFLGQFRCVSRGHVFAA